MGNYGAKKSSNDDQYVANWTFDLVHKANELATQVKNFPNTGNRV
jgi:hypothetical protein